MKILEEAIKVFEERHTQYGDFTKRFKKTARMFTGYLEQTIPGSKVCKIIILEKLSRSDVTYHKDNWLDIINYAAMGDILQRVEEKEKQEKVKPIK